MEFLSVSSNRKHELSYNKVSVPVHDIKAYGRLKFHDPAAIPWKNVLRHTTHPILSIASLWSSRCTTTMDRVTIVKDFTAVPHRFFKRKIMLRSDTERRKLAQFSGSPFTTAVPGSKPNILKMLPTYVPTHSYIYISNPINLAIYWSNFLSVCLSMYLPLSVYLAICS